MRFQRSLTWPLCLQGLESLRHRTHYAAIVHVCFAPVYGGYARLLVSNFQTLPGRQEAAVRIRSRLLAQTVTASPPGYTGLSPIPPSILSAADCAGGNRPCIARRLHPHPSWQQSLRISDVGVVLVVFVGPCLFAGTVISRITVCAALTRESTVGAWP